MNYISDFKMTEMPTPDDDMADKMMQGNKFSRNKN